MRINYSSLELLQTCPRKAFYRLTKQLVKNGEATAIMFGSAIHKALEHWYQLPQEERLLPDKLKEDAELMAFGKGTTTMASQGALEAIRQFVLAKPELSFIEEFDKHSLSNGIKILRAYFKRYHDDGLFVYSDNQGALIERIASKVIHEEPGLTIEYFGTVDVILQNKETGIIMVADHKTTSALGKEFYDRCKPNPQYTGYVWLAKEALGIDTNLFMINGIQTAKTKVEFARQVTDRGQEDFSELTQSVVHFVKTWLLLQEQQIYPMAAPNPCSMYGGCAYRALCEVPAEVKAAVEQMSYVKLAQ